MLMGAVIGGVVGLVFYLIQQQQKKKQEANETLDSNMEEKTSGDSENS